MPTIVYWDFLNGNDSAPGDGTAAHPYKTLSKATTGLTAGDEARCAKSPDPANLGCNLTFTDGSNSVATAADLTAVLGAKDFVSLNTVGETWWEISSINSTTITLVVAYRGTGGTGTGYKRGITGSIAGVTVADGTSTTAVHTISGSGTSGGNLKLSFGWNLAGTPQQDGQTFFFQSNTTKGGWAVYGSAKNYIELDGARLGLLRYAYGIIGDSSSNWTITNCTCNGNTTGIYGSSGSNNWIITSCTCNGNASYGFYVYGIDWTVTSSTCNGNASYGIYCYSLVGLTITSSTCNGNASNGIYGSKCSNLIITSCTCNGNVTGIYANNSSNWTITSCTCNGNTSYGIRTTTGCMNIVSSGYAHDESTWSNAGKIYDWYGNGQRLVSIQESESGGAARNRVYFYGGYTQDNAAEARSGSCLQFNPKSATYWIEQSFFVPAAASTARTVAIYLKDDGSFNGTVWLELWFNGVRITGPTEQTMTTDYAQYSIVGAADDIPIAGVLELKVLVYGTAGCVYADDISYS